jgi:hypothetical protein
MAALVEKDLSALVALAYNFRMTSPDIKDFPVQRKGF